jgi:hypothetical protein
MGGTFGWLDEFPFVVKLPSFQRIDRSRRRCPGPDSHRQAHEPGSGGANGEGLPRLRAIAFRLGRSPCYHAGGATPWTRIPLFIPIPRS